MWIGLFVVVDNSRYCMVGRINNLVLPQKAPSPGVLKFQDIRAEQALFYGPSSFGEHGEQAKLLYVGVQPSLPNILVTGYLELR